MTISNDYGLLLGVYFSTLPSLFLAIQNHLLLTQNNKFDLCRKAIVMLIASDHSDTDFADE